MDVKVGSTRLVVLVWDFAIKLPRLYSWKSFLCGILANMQENEFSRLRLKELCPVLFCSWGGFVTVMPRCEEVRLADWDSFNYWEFVDGPDPSCILPVEEKRSSFGILDGRIVAIDYGS